MVYRFGHHLPPNRCSLSRFMVEKAGELPILVEGVDSTCGAFCLMSKTVKVQVKDGLAVDAQKSVGLRQFCFLLDVERMWSSFAKHMFSGSVP